MATPPIKRHPALQPLSREHHNGLLLCWKIRTGLSNSIDTARIKAYTKWFWEQHLKKHFEEEEKFIFPILPADHTLIIQALDEHRRLEELFEDSAEVSTARLQGIQELLNAHIRFEERVLFNKIQETATEEELKLIEQHHAHVVCEDWKDEFWF